MPYATALRYLCLLRVVCPSLVDASPRRASPSLPPSLDLLLVSLLNLARIFTSHVCVSRSASVYEQSLR